MKVELAKLRPNPWRDFSIDPIDQAASERLVESIHESGFWGGSALRYNKAGELEIACGHSRIDAAIQAGITHADLQVFKYDDEKMIHVYARENLTQRGDESSAMFGAVASAVRYLLKGVLTGNAQVSKIFDTSRASLGNIEKRIAEGDGIGQPALEHFFAKVTTMNPGVIQYHLANLKDSGEYARIVKEITAEIAKEQADERAELERREAEAAQAKLKAEEAERLAVEAKATADKKAAKEAEENAAAAKKKEAEAQAKVEEKSGTKKTKETAEKAATNTAKKHGVVKFDFNGVSKYLTTDHQLRVFKKVVMREAMKKHIPVSAQAKLAALLIKYANEFEGGKLTARFIETYLAEIVKNSSNMRKGGDLDMELTPTALQMIEYENARHRFNDLQHHFCRNWAGVTNDARTMIGMKDKYPTLSFTITQEMRTTIRFAFPVIQQLIDKLNIKTTP